MLNASRTSGPSLEVFASQGAIDAEGRAGSFGCGNDRQLDVFDDVASDEHARDTGRFVLAALDPAVACELAAEGFRER